MERSCVVESQTWLGIGLDGLAAWDSVGWVNALDGQPRSGHGKSRYHVAQHDALEASALFHGKPETQTLSPGLGFGAGGSPPLVLWSLWF